MDDEYAHVCTCLIFCFSEFGTHKAILERMQLWDTVAVPYDIKVSPTIC